MQPGARQMHAVLAAVFAFLWYWKRRRNPHRTSKTGGVKTPSLAGSRSGSHTAQAAVTRERASSIIGPSPSATLIKASESLSFTAGDGAAPVGGAADAADTNGHIAFLSSLSQTASVNGELSATAATDAGMGDSGGVPGARAGEHTRRVGGAAQRGGRAGGGLVRWAV